MSCFIGEMPGFEGQNLFSEKPIVAILESEGRREPCEDGAHSDDFGHPIRNYRTAIR